MFVSDINSAAKLPGPILLKKRNEWDQPDRSTKIKRNTKNQKEDYKEKHIFCKFCEYKITTTAYQTEIQGSFKHTFLNPSGHLFEIGCFTRADGCTSLGIPSDEWTWFREFKWQVSLCGQCSNHLGWFYHSGEDRTFFGLILNTLI